MTDPPRSPLTAVPPRVPGSIRRTSHVDVRWAPAGGGATVRLAGAARDLRTTADGAVTVAEAAVTATLDEARRVVDLSVTPAGGGDAAALFGVPVASGFRRQAAAAFPGARGTPAGLLLDDLPVAALIGGYAMLREAGRAGRGADATPVDVESRMADLCSGWRRGGTMLVQIAEGRGVPVQDCPPAPDSGGGDPLAWHQVDPLPAGAMRRRRLIDVLPGDALEVFATFRDTYGEPEGHEGVLHEYTLRATVGPSTFEIESIVAEPRVLPFPECPLAAPFVAKLAGERTTDLRSRVPQLLGGLESCTHLNDLLRSLADVDALSAR